MLEEKDLQAIAGLLDIKLKEQKAEILMEFNTVIEDKVSHEIKTIAEGHADIMERLPRVNEVEDLKSRVRILERIIKEHSQTIDELKKAQ